MGLAKSATVSIIVPAHNEAPNVVPLYRELVAATAHLPYRFEYVFVDDGSSDDTVPLVRRLAKRDRRVRLVEFARNFGKEAAVTAGLHNAKGEAAIVLDADLQHPPSLIAKFIEKWQRGAQIVVGVKSYSNKESWFKRASSNWFYQLLGRITSAKITPHACDYRLLDRTAINAFNRFTERNRLTRGLVDWIGFTRDYVRFQVPPRRSGDASYGYRKLFALAINSFTAYSLLPLKLAGYLGVVILITAGPAGFLLYVEQYLLGDPYNLNVSGTGFLALLILFLIGLVLACLGLVAIYIARIHDEVMNRPLYIVKPGGQEGEEA